MVHDEKNKVIKIELWNYTAIRDLKEKAKQAFKKIRYLHIKKCRK